MYEVYILQEGYSHYNEEGDMLANGTSTLIKGQNCVIVVDTLSPWDAESLKLALSTHNVKPENVTHLVCTHGHPDHVGNNNLFSNARQHVVGYSVHHQDKYRSHPFEAGEHLVIDGEDVVVIPTPGHTNDSVSVKVKTSQGVIVIAGDLFEKEEDIFDASIWKDAGSENEKVQEENRRMILKMADFIVPGHGKMFKVNSFMRDFVSN